MALKLVSIVSLPAIRAMNGNRGRMAVQVAHGLLHALWDAERRFPQVAAAYRAQASAFKISLATEDPEILEALHGAYGGRCGVSLVVETGSRVSGNADLSKAALTGLGIGPVEENELGDDIGSLRPFL